MQIIVVSTTINFLDFWIFGFYSVKIAFMERATTTCCHKASMDNSSNTNLPHYFYVPYSNDPQDGLKLVRLGRMIHPQLSQSNLEPIQSLKQESHQSEKQELQQESQKQEPQQESHQSYLKIFCFVSFGFVSINCDRI